MSRIYRTHPLYTVWCRMRERCYRTADVSYPNYGARGIGVCEEWRVSSKAFIDWALEHGWQRGLQLDRIDNNGDYTPKNCRFVTRKQNSVNRRTNRLITHAGRTMTISEWSEETGLKFATLYRRLQKVWPVERALNTSAGKWTSRHLSCGNDDLTVSELSQRTGLTVAAIYNRLRRGWSHDRIVSETPHKESRGVPSLR